MGMKHFTAKTDKGLFAGRGRIDSLGRVYWDEQEDIGELCKAGMRQVIFEIPARGEISDDASEE